MAEIEKLAIVEPLTLMRETIEGADGKPDPANLKVILDLHREWTRDRAAEQFAAALSGFHSECPPIVKHKKADRYKFAPYEDLLTTIGPFLNKYKIVVTITGPTRPDALDLTVHTRVGIHVESHPHVAPMPDLTKIVEANKISESQAYGFARSYAKRYAVTDALNLVVIGEDTDARLNPPGITDEQVREINTLADQCEEAGDPVKWDRLFAVYEMDAEAGLGSATQPAAAKILTTLRDKLKRARKAVKA